MKFLLLALIFTFNSLEAEFTHYLLSEEPFDVVIPCTYKDKEILEYCIEGIKLNAHPLGRVIVISPEKLTDNAEFYSEADFPFSKNEIAKYLFGQPLSYSPLYPVSKRINWYYQQLLKFYAPFVIPGISSNVLILDADTIFLNSVVFLDKQGQGLYNVGSDNNICYFTHYSKLMGTCVKRVFPAYSGITHHMLFQRAVLEDLFQKVETFHKQEFWKAFCSCVNKYHSSGASEYEIYFNFLFSQTDQAKIRPLKWGDVTTLNLINAYKENGYDYISCHDHSREERWQPVPMK